MRTFGIWNMDQSERLDIAAWYPGGTPRSFVDIDGRRIAASRNGRPAQGFYPVIILSHDASGNRFSHHDLASSLAAAGFVVIAPTHQGDSVNNSNGIFTAEILAQRPRHLLRALEAVLGSPQISQLADESRIGVLGVGFGSITAAQLAGIRPDFRTFDAFCAQSPEDPLCTPWTSRRLEQMPEAMAALEQQEGQLFFTPPLSLFAPPLVAVVPEKPQPDLSIKALEAHNTPGIFHSIFENLDLNPQVGKGSPTVLEAYGVKLVLSSDAGLFAPVTALVEAAPPEDEIPAPEPAHEAETGKTGAPLTYRRPAERRAIKAIALMAPAGGMFMPQTALKNLYLPLAVVEAQEDELYPREAHSLPYYQSLPTVPAKLVLKDADHYSTFAPCPTIASSMLPQACGKASASQRERIAAKRDEFLIYFFKNALGDPLEPVGPSNLVAAEPPRESKKEDPVK